LWDILSRRLWLILQVCGAVFLSAVVVGLVQPKVYRATAWLLLTQGRQITSQEIATPAEAESKIQSEVPIHLRLIRRPEVADRVKQQLHLTLPTGRMIQNVSCSEVSGTQQSHLLALNYEDTNPKTAQEIANSWVAVYVDDTAKRGGLSLAAALDYVDKQLKSIEQELRGTEDQLAAKQDLRSTGAQLATSLDQRQEKGPLPSSVDRLAQLEAALAASRVKQAAAKAQLDQTRQLLAQEPPQVQETEEQPTALVQAMEKQMAELASRREKMLDSYYADSSEVKALDDQIARLEKQLARTQGMTRTTVTRAPNPTRTKLKDSLVSLQADLRSSQAEEGVLRQQLAEQEQIVSRLPGAQIAAARLKRRQIVLEQVYAMLLSRSYELQLQKAMAAPNVQVVELADVPTVPVKPQMGTLAGIGLILGLLIAITVAVIVDQVEDTFGTVEEIHSYAQRRIIGSISRLRNGNASALVVVDDPRSTFANSVRMMASMLRIEMDRRGITSVMVTSGGRGEGKTSICANLAAALAGGGGRVLVVDGDLHNPTLHRLFGVPNNKGLSNVLVGQMPLSEAVIETTVPGVQLLTSGPLPPAPSGLLATEDTARVIEQVNGLADLVIWDTPPAAILPDATILGGHIGGCVFVVGARAKRRMVRQMLASFDETGVPVLGVAANQVRPSGGYYYYYYYDYYRRRDESDETAKD
jgi:capsular exopolysaccharide synthesis family protein